MTDTILGILGSPALHLVLATLGAALGLAGLILSRRARRDIRTVDQFHGTNIGNAIAEFRNHYDRLNAARSAQLDGLSRRTGQLEVQARTTAQAHNALVKAHDEALDGHSKRLMKVEALTDQVHTDLAKAEARIDDLKSEVRATTKDVARAEKSEPKSGGITFGDGNLSGLKFSY